LIAASGVSRLFKTLFSGLSGRGAEGRLSILVYHRVLPEPDPMLPTVPSAAEFRWQMELVAGWFNVLPLSEAVDRLYAGRLPRRALCVTFDDGYADNHEVALPIAESLGLPLGFFIASGYLDGGIMWNDTVTECFRRTPDPREMSRRLGVEVELPDASLPERRRLAAEAVIERLKHSPPEVRAEGVEWLASRADGPLPQNLMMTSEQIADLARRGMDIGAHTVTHPILALLDGPSARREIAAGKARLEEIVGSPVGLFAYPNGKAGRDFTERDADLLARHGFKAAVTTEPGVSSRATPPFGLRRFTPWDRTPLRFALRLAMNYGTSSERARALDLRGVGRTGQGVDSDKLWH
jgi:peptidoglycan/xylan/chitin deacetylase (PgdA/CDA1 family)